MTWERMFWRYVRRGYDRSMAVWMEDRWERRQRKVTLDEQQAICDAATPGPWEGRWVPSGMPSTPCKFGVIEMQRGLETSRMWCREDAEFIATARTEWPKLIAAVRRWQEEERLWKEREAALLAEIERLREAMRVGCRAMGWPEDGSWLVHARESAEQVERLKAAGKVLAESMRTNWAGEISRKEDEACRVFEEGE